MTHLPAPKDALYHLASVSAGATALNSYIPEGPIVNLAAGSLGLTGGKVANAGSATTPSTYVTDPHENRQPFLALNYCICWEGDFPAA